MDTPTPAQSLSETDVVDAAARLVAAFSRTDTQEYFAAFAPDATFVFHTEPARLESRAEYEALWAFWLADGWSVTSCESTEAHVQVYGTSAVFSHTVLTTAGTPGATATTRERETIVFTRSGGRILAVHEHLSPVPDPGFSLEPADAGAAEGAEAGPTPVVVVA
ncbi:nuclear transport factor 2 family protein [Arthrobacter sp. zg-Y1171]|uniref:YybH family protein n=1 Tax=Arthrobacter sp. zg-Y1171 TaxID=2964610 RepID=UPI0021039CB1|nr:nuclear transport factor 2 family protein [Arthrobacter sp. zg-Y1171]MCQ1995824.1 nuclear transport factor 2 family protein [Arthrobacter sp. zg-Y1171]UWX83095.1 nuclear transport factor 2 family protein [Arthrobacter sp. zg-Y1171]